MKLLGSEPRSPALTPEDHLRLDKTLESRRGQEGDTKAAQTGLQRLAAAFSKEISAAVKAIDNGITNARLATIVWLQSGNAPKQIGTDRHEETDETDETDELQDIQIVRPGGDVLVSHHNNLGTCAASDGGVYASDYELGDIDEAEKTTRGLDLE